MRALKTLAALWFSLSLSGCAGFVCCAPAPVKDPLEQALLAEGVDPGVAVLVIYRLEDEKTWTHGGARIDQRFSPASTSKIPHTLLALETGAVSSMDETFTWDGETRFVDSWNQDQTFALAFQRSAVWVYQIVVPRIGPDRLTEGFAAFGYGNGEIGGPDKITHYWLSAPLAISAAEQVAFLSRLARRTLPLSQRTYDLAVPAMELARGEGWVLYGKTGWKGAVEGDGSDIGWFVGWLEQSGGEAPGTYAFAFNMDMPGGMAQAPKRRAATERALRNIGALPPG
ncbi:MAG TPA: class D beta-lactamase [Hyphomonas sp.]|nr:class D beta-lactamase [Hyphomonas sp.]HRJ01023.1 class D beta-lactamase [Hyphomonas sp.]